MTSGTKDTRIQVANPSGYEAGYQLYGNYRSWNGEDRLYQATPYKGKHPRNREYQRVVRVEGHQVVETMTKVDYNPERRSEEQLAAELDRLKDHPYSVDWEERNLGTCYFDVMVAPHIPSGSPRYGSITGFGFTPGFPGDSWDQKHADKLNEDLYERVAGNDFNLASALGAEGIDSVRTIGDTALRMKRSIQALFRGQTQRALDILRYGGHKGWQRLPAQMDASWTQEQLAIYRDALKTLWRPPRGGGKDTPWYLFGAEQWLEYHLAVAPLFGDVVAASQKLAHLLEIPHRQAYSAKRTAKVDAGVQQTTSQAGAYWSVNEFRHAEKLKFIASEPPSFARLLGVYDLDVAIWNALPLTFMSDYIVDIGNWTQQRAAARSLVGTFVHSIRKEWVFSDLFGSHDANGFGYDFIESSNASHYRQGSLQRTVVDALPTSKYPRFRGLESLKSWQRMTTAVSVLGLMMQRGNAYTDFR